MRGDPRTHKNVRVGNVVKVLYLQIRKSSMNDVNTTIVQTPYINIGLSEFVGIVPLLHFLHVHFFVFEDHLAHDVLKFSLNI